MKQLRFQKLLKLVLLGKHNTEENCTDLTGLYDSYLCIVYLEWKHHASVLKSGKL